ncbi:acyltransferase family protein [Streptomyces sp. NRRL S-244]|uniref:acyltransferase family protein n=1 Tax=Streptomyces sp. NRRL S-244 TaxID=1463897 RepID=UPI0005689916|nr:acyltransferase [Streptomyces sp. NRRL S-244]
MTSPSPTAAPSAAPGPSRSKLPSLTGLRFIAAALVFFFHATFSDPPMNPFADQGWEEGFRWLFSKAGWMGVSFFFVLSGFVLTWSAKPNDTITGFWRRRLLKIFPNHIVMWALAMVLFAGAMTPLSAWLPNLFLIHSWFPQHATFISVNPPSWSLCSELLFYLLFPPVRMFEFVLGMILARLVLAGAFPRIRILPAAALCVVGYAVALAVPFLYGLNVATIVPVALLICAVARADVEGAPTVLRGRTMQWLGEVSFGFYLAQYVVMYFGRTALMDEKLFAPLPGVLVLLGFFLATLLVGWLLLVCVERPVMRRWARPAPRRSAAAEPAREEREPAPALR